MHGRATVLLRGVARQAVKITGGGKAVLSFTTEKLGGMGITTVFTVQVSRRPRASGTLNATLAPARPAARGAFNASCPHLRRCAQWSWPRGLRLARVLF